MNLIRTIAYLLFAAPRPEAVNRRAVQRFTETCNDLRHEIERLNTPQHVFTIEKEIRHIYNWYKGKVPDARLIDATDELDVLLKARASEIGAVHLLERLAL
jgi:hypothetical protein